MKSKKKQRDFTGGKKRGGGAIAKRAEGKAATFFGGEVRNKSLIEQSVARPAEWRKKKRGKQQGKLGNRKGIGVKRRQARVWGGGGLGGKEKGRAFSKGGKKTRRKKGEERVGVTSLSGGQREGFKTTAVVPEKDRRGVRPTKGGLGQKKKKRKDGLCGRRR